MATLMHELDATQCPVEAAGLRVFEGNRPRAWGRDAEKPTMPHGSLGPPTTLHKSRLEGVDRDGYLLALVPEVSR